MKSKLVSFVFAFVLSALLQPALSVAAPAYREGDLIFHQSKGFQSLAILEATGSPWSHVGIIFKNKSGGWVVAEASQPVRIVSLTSFMNRGRDGGYRIYRARDFKAAQVPALRAAVETEIGKPYDIYFEWSDDSIYCSELVYKAFQKATGIELGDVQKFSDLRLDGPFVRALIQQRLTKTGRELNPNEPIVTPISQMNDADLELVAKKGP